MKSVDDRINEFKEAHDTEAPVEDAPTEDVEATEADTATTETEEAPVTETEAEPAKEVEEEEVKEEAPATEEEAEPETEIPNEEAPEEEAEPTEDISKSETEEAPETEAEPEKEEEVEAEEAPETEAEPAKEEAPAEEAEEDILKSMIPAELVVKMFGNLADRLEVIEKSMKATSPDVADTEKEVVNEPISKSMTEDDLEGKSVMYAPKEDISKSMTEEVAETEEAHETEAEPTEEAPAFDYAELNTRASDFFFEKVSALRGDDANALRSYLINANHGVTPDEATIENIERIITLK